MDYEDASSDRALVLYTYSESETARPNLDYFLKKGLHDAADFVFILNGDTTVKDLIPVLDNIRVIERENTCYDLGSMGEVLRQDDLWRKYKRFITMNASIRGPFLPTYDSPLCWTDIFLNRLNNKTKLVGTTMNCDPRPHVQSMLWATDDVSMSILLDPNLAHAVALQDPFGEPEDPIGMSFCHETMDQAIHTETGSTQLILSQGYEVDVMMTAYAPATDPDNYCKFGQHDDILYDGQYYGTNIHPYETVFVKANRNIDPALLSTMTEWHLELPSNSWTACAPQ